MLLSGDANYWESMEYALNRFQGEYDWLWNIRSGHVALIEDEVRAQAIREQMDAHRRPRFDKLELSNNPAGNPYPSINLRGIIVALHNQGKKANEINPIWEDVCQRQNLIMENTWSVHYAKLVDLGASLSLEREKQMIQELLWIRYPLLANLKQEFANCLNLTFAGEQAE